MQQVTVPGNYFHRTRWMGNKSSNSILQPINYTERSVNATLANFIFNMRKQEVTDCFLFKSKFLSVIGCGFTLGKLQCDAMLIPSKQKQKTGRTIQNITRTRAKHSLKVIK